MTRPRKLCSRRTGTGLRRREGSAAVGAPNGSFPPNGSVLASFQSHTVKPAKFSATAGRDCRLLTPVLTPCGEDARLYVPDLDVKITFGNRCTKSQTVTKKIEARSPEVGFCAPAFPASACPSPERFALSRDRPRPRPTAPAAPAGGRCVSGPLYLARRRPPNLLFVTCRLQGPLRKHKKPNVFLSFAK